MAYKGFDMTKYFVNGFFVLACLHAVLACPARLPCSLALLACPAAMGTCYSFEKRFEREQTFGNGDSTILCFFLPLLHLEVVKVQLFIWK